MSTGELFAMKEINAKADRRSVEREVAITRKLSSCAFTPKLHSVLTTVFPPYL